MHKLLEKLDKELHKYADKEGELTKAEWEAVFDAIEARKDLLTSMAMEGEDQYGNYANDESNRYSGNYPFYNRYSGGRMMDPDMQYSYRGRGGVSNRSNGGNGSSNRRYSMNYSGHGDPKQNMLDNLYEAMNSADSEEERQMIQKCINKLEY